MQKKYLPHQAGKQCTTLTYLSKLRCDFNSEEQSFRSKLTELYLGSYAKIISKAIL